MSLLDKAKKVTLYQKRGRRNVSDETIELTLGWLKNEVDYMQIAKTMGFTGSNVYNFLSRNLRAAYEEGKLKIK